MPAAREAIATESNLLHTVLEFGGEEEAQGAMEHRSYVQEQVQMHADAEEEWRAANDESGREYWYSPRTRETSWERPQPTHRGVTRSAPPSPAAVHIYGLTTPAGCRPVYVKLGVAHFTWVCIRAKVF